MRIVQHLFNPHNLICNQLHLQMINNQHNIKQIFYSDNFLLQCLRIPLVLDVTEGVDEAVAVAAGVSMTF